jgi:hypothetical protein
LIVRIHADSSVTLDDPDTFTAFHVAAPDLEHRAILAALGPDARDAGNDELWLSIDRLHALGARYGGPDWRPGCDRMLEYAKSKGWIDESGSHVRAHVER